MQVDPERSELTKLVSVPGLVAVAILGAMVAVLASLLGPGNVLGEVATELVASFGSTILVLAVFGLVFRSGLERLVRGAPGGEPIAQSVERLADVMQGPEAQSLGAQEPGLEAKVDQMCRDVRSLIDRDVPNLRKEVAELRAMLKALQQERGD